MDQPSNRRVLADAGLIATVAATLVSIHLLFPKNLQVQLALDHSDPQWYALFTAAYVHAGVDHLLGNVLGYLLAACYTYWLCLQFGRRRWFWRTTLALLLVVPIVVNVANLLIFGSYVPAIEGYSRGFSGVVGAFGGFLFVAFVLAVRDIYDSAAAQVVGVSLFLLLLLMLDFVYAGTVEPLVGAAVAFGIGAQIVGVLYERDWELPKIESTTRVLAIRGVSGLLVVAVVTLLVIALFPTQPVQGGAMVNIFGHGIGFVIGIFASISTTLPKINFI